ncbi:hypothetical protein ACIGN6_32210 [Streptomyces sp. NPDC053792]|uniref:hypothetical protein n=1 Tax=Streptomyces sp. NPDC053792 TaxID=3365716 RepID=UPI0037D3F69A
MSVHAAPEEGDQPVVRQYSWCMPALHGTASYRKFCRTLDLTPLPDGYGVLLVADPRWGGRYTLATADAYFLSLLHHGLEEAGPLDGVSFPPGKFEYRSGWPELPPPTR